MKLWSLGPGFSKEQAVLSVEPKKGFDCLVIGYGDRICFRGLAAADQRMLVLYQDCRITSKAALRLSELQARIKIFQW